MRQRALVTACLAVLLVTVGLIAPVAGSNDLDVPAEVVDAELDGLPTATDDDGDPLTDAAPAVPQHAHPHATTGADAHAAWPVGAPGGVRSEPVATPIAFSMVAFTVPEGVGVSFRTRAGGEAWEDWQAAHVHPEEGPDPSSAEADADAARADATAPDAAGGPGGERRFSEPVWVGEADELQLRVDGGDPEAVGVHVIDSLGQNRGIGQRIGDAVVAMARGVTGNGRPAAAAVDQPDIVTRSGWGADESLRSGSAIYGHGVEAAVVHHTVTGNAYSQSEAPSVVRAIYHYHTQSRGWRDIGYNFLVDRFGTVYQGRAGGLEEPVQGAHAAGYNAATTGVAFMGSHQHGAGTSLAGDAEDSAVELLQWLFDVHHLDAETDADLGDRTTPRLVGHGDLGSTDCPGGYVRDRMDAIRSAVVAGQEPMLTSPKASTTDADLGEDVAFTGGLKPAGQWQLTVSDDDGRTVHTDGGFGAQLASTWTAHAAGVYDWELASPGRRPARGEIGVMDAVAERLGGEGPIGGAVELSQLAFPDDDAASHAVVARVDVFADAMAGGPLAGSQGPLLLTPSDRLDGRVADELARVLPPGETVYVLGGEAAIDEAVARELAETWEVERFAGGERTDTAARIAEAVLERSGADRAMVARSAPDGINPWADALAGSGWGAREGVPVLLTPTDRLTDPPAAVLEALDATIVLGGTAAISEDVVEALPDPRRVRGSDRAGTARAIAEELWGRTSGRDGDVFLIGAGWDDQAWQRALASAPLAALEDAPLLLSMADQVPGSTASYLERLGYGSVGTARGWVLEPDSVIDVETWTQLNVLMQ